jgi:hypothetical protein
MRGLICGLRQREWHAAVKRRHRPVEPGLVGAALTTAKIGGVTVLTNAGGFTLYWFAPDTPAKSNCDGSCATFWPPVKGPATPGRPRPRSIHHPVGPSVACGWSVPLSSPIVSSRSRSAAGLCGVG